MTKERTLDPRAVAANDIFTQPGVFAILLGSGVSTGSGILTGWGIVSQLVQRIATVSAPQDFKAAEDAALDPEAWWHKNSTEPLGYSSLLAALARTPASRRAQIAGFFEASESEIERGEKLPSRAHRSVAALIKSGHIRVIVTTNFDRLLEQALDDVGVMYQVISNGTGVKGMTPLAHAAATIIKVNGDWADLNMRNTADELASYPPPLSRLLRQVFDEYGLIVSGWSADWDSALVRALEATASRRYPLFWDSRSAKGAKPASLISGHRGLVLPSSSADIMFSDLLERINAISRLAEPPLATEIAVQRLKRYVLDPVRRIELRDLVLDAVERTIAASREVPIEQVAGWGFEDYFAAYERATLPTVQLLASGVYFDLDDSHGDLWISAIQRLLGTRDFRSGSYDAALLPLRHLPALLALRSMSIAAIGRGSDSLFLRLLTEPTWTSPLRQEKAVRALHVLHLNMIIDKDSANSMPRLGGSTRWSWPASKVVRESLSAALSSLFPDAGELERLNRQFEYRLAFAQFMSPEGHDWNPADGEYLLSVRHADSSEPLFEEARLLSEISQDSSSPWRKIFSPDDDGAKVVELREYLFKLARNRH